MKRRPARATDPSRHATGRIVAKFDAAAATADKIMYAAIH